MTIDLINPDELRLLWLAISSEPWLHFDDAGPKSYEEWARFLADNEIMIFSARMGRKWVGAVGFQEKAKQLRGIYFVPECRGGVIPKTAVTAVLAILSPVAVKARYFADNDRAARFLAKLGFEATGAEIPATIRGGQEVALHEVEFNPLRENLRL